MASEPSKIDWHFNKLELNFQFPCAASTRRFKNQLNNKVICERHC